MGAILEENPDANISCVTLTYPVCPDVEENFFRATQAPGRGLELCEDAVVRVIMKVRELWIVSFQVCKVHVQHTGVVRSGVIEDETFGGFIAVPCGRDKEYLQRGFVLARLIGDPVLGADDFVKPWLDQKGISISPNSVSRIIYDYDSGGWREMWSAISKL